MIKLEQSYIDILKQAVYDKISAGINKKTIDQIVRTDLYKSHIENKGSARFQVYYFETLNNESLFLVSKDFFRQFKRQYSLQGIDNSFLDRLEKNKSEILKLLRITDLTKLYFDTFSKAKIKHGNKTIEKDLGSFFTKLVHTFRPNEYSAIDNPIKNYFGLTKESFFISLSIISEEYKHWATDNPNLLQEIREKFKNIDKNQTIQHELLTDIKLLDLIFWSKANRTK